MGTRIPQWALQDVTVRPYTSFPTRTDDTPQRLDLSLWNSTKAMAIGGRNPPLTL